MSDTVIRVENLGKKYIISHQKQERYTVLRDVIANGAKSVGRKLLKPMGKTMANPAVEEFWALKDVSFEIKRGDRVGIIGRNGAGKSTLLKILSRITEPTKGRISINGRVASLLEVGTGFHPELTGRENIFLNGAILGMSKAEIKRKFDEIVAFAEVEKFLDTPVKRYSSGMYVRLAFAVAAHLEPEILVVDEVLAVGDAQFQKKCLGKMEDVAEKEGRTVLFVTHNMATAQALCTKGIALQKGKVQCVGSIQDAIKHYLHSIEKNTNIDLSNRIKKEERKLAWYTGIKFRSEENAIIDTVHSGQTIDIILEYCAEKSGLKLDFAVSIYGTLGESLLNFGTHYSYLKESNLPQNGSVICRIPKLPLPEGRYTINLALKYGTELIDHVSDATVLDVQATDYYGTGKLPPQQLNKVLVEHNWLLPNQP
jgi:lipopolysaccharide transport system ATP-binding protein